jgi:NAD(P)-dependent dehydrogenase (short-subunit alcohol dehydrogenase family)
VEDRRKLEGKVAIVTGAGSTGVGVGTGKATSILLARAGAKVVLVNRSTERANDVLRIIESEGGTASVVLADLAEKGGCQRVADEAIARYGGVDILVNNAAITLPRNILDTTPEDYERVIAINMTAPFLLSRAVIPSMIDRSGGAIINITSIAALRGVGGKGCTAYAMSKGGLDGMMIDLADFFGKKGIRVNCIAPGMINTPMRNATVVAAGGNPETLNLGAATPLGREGDAWDVARAVLFLAGPDGAYITGVHIPVDGGKISTSH